MAAKLQWSHAFSDVETYYICRKCLENKRFNGATPSQTWKRLRLWLASRVLAPASMEPRLLRRGNNEQGQDEGIKAGRFNGATPSQTWKPSPNWPHSATRTRFNGATPSQTWKHRRCLSIATARMSASMEPRLLRRGNKRLSKHGTGSIGFNGATPSQTWKQIYWPITASEADSFNGATPSQTWKQDVRR